MGSNSRREPRMKRRDYVKAFSPVCHASASVAWRAYSPAARVFPLDLGRAA